MSWSKHGFVSTAFEQAEGDAKSQLASEMENINVDRVSKIFERCTNPIYIEGSTVSPLPSVVRGSTLEQIYDWEKVGLESIRQGKVAVVLLAGGQGSRLGYNHPKGMYNFGLPSQKTLFQIQAERIRNLENRAGGDDVACIPWYIMTSDATYDETVQFFKEKSFFGLKEKNIVFFKQSKLPATDTKGNILLASSSSVSYESLKYSGNRCFLLTNFCTL